MGFSELIFNTNVDKNLIANYMLNEGNDDKFKKKGYVAMYMFISFFSELVRLIFFESAQLFRSNK